VLFQKPKAVLSRVWLAALQVEEVDSNAVELPRSVVLQAVERGTRWKRGGEQHARKRPPLDQKSL